MRGLCGGLFHNGVPRGGAIATTSIEIPHLAPHYIQYFSNSSLCPRLRLSKVAIALPLDLLALNEHVAIFFAHIIAQFIIAAQIMNS